MPLYRYVCPDGHEAELIRPIGTDAVDCHRCDGQMDRVSVNRVAQGHVEADTRGMYRRFTEATAEMDHAYGKVEANVGQTVRGPNLWKQSLAKADAMRAAGEA